MMQQPPTEAIRRGRRHLRRLLERTLLDRGPDHELWGVIDNFEQMAEWIEESDGWEPSEAQQGPIPIPERYAEP